MLAMHSAIISDATCLVILSKIDSLFLLNKLYGSILTTPQVAAEVRFPLPNWIEVRETISDEMTHK